MQGKWFKKVGSEVQIDLKKCEVELHILRMLTLDFLSVCSVQSYMVKDCRGPFVYYICTWQKMSFPKFVITLLPTKYYLVHVDFQHNHHKWNRSPLFQQCQIYWNPSRQVVYVPDAYSSSTIAVKPVAQKTLLVA